MVNRPGEQINCYLHKERKTTMSIYDYKLVDGQGNEVSMKDYEGKVVLVVNTATGCGFTPQYKDIEAIYEKFHDQGLEVIDIPCNQFAGQAPESDEEIHEFCQLHYNTQFPQMKKSDVNGENELPIYTFLKSQKGFEGFGKGPKALAMSAMLKKIDKNYKNTSDIKWNFTKFLVNRSGEVVARFEPTQKMTDVKEAVAALI
ncbi:glutathione peroxidase [Pseudoramibacter alactolyticus ATCC 23263]|uniref:Glutathione peroxidase n=2 Tax=Pseudoramibacter TaxID=113286 RepID=E6MEP8_9FIRM|nr:glutathione peroxidase [Pseudoramibacter alactolyticus ATCC 23263]